MEVRQMLIAPIITADSFHWHEGVGTVELSDVDPAKAKALYSRLYDDACDIGFRVMNPKTFNIEAFYLSHEDKDASGEDVYGGHFYPVNPVLRNAGVRILVIND
jgi:hypothetical protein